MVVVADVKVRFFASFREATGSSEAHASASDISELLDSLSSSYGEAFGKLVRDRGAEVFVVLVNGRNVGQLGGLTTVLADGDEVSLFPPMSGG